jgi:hypothetical protein
MQPAFLPSAADDRLGGGIRTWPSPNRNIFNTLPTLINRFARWQEQLLDLSQRNRLLNLSITSKRGIPVLTQTPEALLEWLQAGKEVPLLAWAEGNELSAEAWQQIPRAGITQDHASVLAQATRHQALQTPLALTSLLQAAKLLDRGARSVFEESGAHTLYLALHLLEYRDKSTPDTPRFAPLLLLPVRLVIERLRGKVLLRWTGDDATLNITLFEKLKRDFDIDLKAVVGDQDDGGALLGQVVESLTEAIQRFGDWALHPEAHVGMFSFNKFLMWSDLRDNQAALLENPMVRHIASSDLDGVLNTEPVLDAAQLDRAPYSHGDFPLVVAADSSQVAAVAAA